MELRIGVVHTGKELSLELDDSADDIIKQVEAALKNGEAFVWLTDSKGRRVGVTADKIAYIEIDEDGQNRRVGFGR